MMSTESRSRRRILRLLALLAVLACCGFAAAACAEMTVGEEIRREDVTDFCYTVDASSYPPMYQRYRFYLENGKQLFFHESRQGFEWPQTKEDTVASGTLELSDEDWNALWECLRGGKVREREEEITDGDDGPWMYLYWTGAGEDGWEYRFASGAKKAAFETLCSRLAQNHPLSRLYLIRGGSMVPRSWEVFLHGGGWQIRENGEEPRSFDGDLARELQQAVIRGQMETWNGFHGSNPHVLDGESFSLEMWFADGTAVRASGENAFPRGYREAMDKVEDILERDRMAWIAGTFRYEGEGFGGDFTITLNPDGTYTFCEGLLSSYLGSGTWREYDRAVAMRETGGFELEFTFRFEKDCLVYLEAESDAFPYVRLPDEARFARTDNE